MYHLILILSLEPMEHFWILCNRISMNVNTERYLPPEALVYGYFSVNWVLLHIEHIHEVSPMAVTSLYLPDNLHK